MAGNLPNAFPRRHEDERQEPSNASQEAGLDV